MKDAHNAEEDIHNWKHILSDKIKEFFDSHKEFGFGGRCGKFAIDLNTHIGHIGKYFVVTNRAIWHQGVAWFAHVVLKVNDKYYDADGEIENIDVLKRWGMIDPESEEAEQFGLTPEECEDAMIINLSALYGDKLAEYNILKLTDCNITENTKNTIKEIIRSTINKKFDQ